MPDGSFRIQRQSLPSNSFKWLVLTVLISLRRTSDALRNEIGNGHQMREKANDDVIPSREVDAAATHTHIHTEGRWPKRLRDTSNFLPSSCMKWNTHSQTESQFRTSKKWSPSALRSMERVHGRARNHRNPDENKSGHFKRSSIQLDRLSIFADFIEVIDPPTMLH